MLERSASADLQGPRAEGLAALKSLMGDRMTDNAATCAFASLDGAVQTVVETLQVGVPIARIEVLDTRQVQAINAYSKTDLAEAPTLFFEFHGTEAGVKEQVALVAMLPLSAMSAMAISM